MDNGLNVLHLVAGGLTGGAARGAYWLHQAERELGLNSMLVTNGRSEPDDRSVISLATTPGAKLRFALLPRLGTLPARLYRNREPWIFNTGFEGVNFTKHPAYQVADVVHLHWINGLVRMRTLRKVDKPIVWTLRDMWPMTGGCHYSMACDRYQVGCGRCPQLKSRRTWDLTRLVFANKRAALPSQLQLVGISQWLSRCAEHSKVFKAFPVQTISNNIDTRQYFPVEVALARQALGLPKDKRIILAGAQQISNFYKGFDLLLAALRTLDKMDVHVLFFGKVRAQDLSQLGMAHNSLGFLSDTVSLRLAYSAADVFVAPSRMDAFGKTLAEAMACGTPVVCFDATGPADVVEHQLTGYKAAPFNSMDLARGIQWVLARGTDEYGRLCAQARERAETLFDSRVIARKYIDLYEQLSGG